MFLKTNLKYQKFIAHNKKLFQFIPKKKPEKFLIEFNGWQGVQIAYSYFINSIPNVKKLNIVAFENHRLTLNKNYTILDNIKWFIGSFFKIKNFGVYSSFGIQNFILPTNKFSYKFISKQKTKKFFFEKKITKKDIENFEINGVWIGDLIYDTYLKKYSKTTIEIYDDKFINFFTKCIQNFLFWEEYFRYNKISGIAVTHALYTYAIPARIALKKNIPVFSVSDTTLFRITKKQFSSKKKITGVEYQHNYFRKIFDKFKSKEKKKYLTKGKNFLNMLIRGKKKYHYMYNKNINHEITRKRFFRNNNKKKIVIYAHSFFDSPHLRGNFLFSDFNEWLKFLSKISKKTNYDWYLKPHPAYIDDNQTFINKFLKENKHIKKIDINASNYNLIKEGLYCALTIYGSCASELSYYGVKVINADRTNPHSNYNFSFNPKTIKELEDLIININKRKLNYSKNELYEYHYMNQFFFHKNYLFQDINNLHRRQNKRQKIYSLKMYNYWIKNFDCKKHENIKNSILNFYNSGDYILGIKHNKNY